MFKKLLISTAAAAALLSIAVAPASAETWKLLGSQKAGFSADKDVFYVGQGEGYFDALKFKVTGNRVAVADVKVFYGNGTTEHLNVKEHLLPGELTRAYDLKGDHRLIKRIEVLYETEGNRDRGRATVHVYGQAYEATSGGGHTAGWEAIGTRAVGFHVDHDAIRVGADKGRFTTLRLKVSDHDVYMYNLRVRFQNGDVQELPVNTLLQVGSWTRPLDLTGDKRTIDRVDMVYRTKPGFYGQAHVTVFGKH